MPHPLPQPLPNECRKAEKIVRSFIENRNGLDGVRATAEALIFGQTEQFSSAFQVIPGEVLAKAKGFAIFTVYKAGFVLSARAGSGVVIARLPNGSESLS
jgi:lipid-binding SYLF domain-containing protein